MTAWTLLLLLVAMAVPMRSAAEVAGTGTFDIFATADGGLDFDGTIAFDGGMHSVLGRQVNLARDIGTMTYDGEVLGEPSALTAIFTLEADADETDVSFAAGGSASCAAPACIGGRTTFAGRLEVLSDDEGALPDGAFTFDGTTDIDELGEGFGTFAINAFPLLSTPVGPGVEVGGDVQAFLDSLANAMRTFAARAVFSEVQSEGVTSFVGLSAFSGALPAGIALDPAVSVFVDVQTTALFDGLRVCLAFTDEDADGMVDGTDIEASRLRLLHAGSFGTPLLDVTATPSAGEVCGDLPAAGTVVIGVAAVGGGTTTTTVPAGGTTTSTVAGGGSTTTTSTVTTVSTTTSSSAPGAGSTTTSSTVASGSSTTTSTTPGGTSTSTTVAVPGSTSTTCMTSVTSTTSMTTVTTTTTTPTTAPGPMPTTTTTAAFVLASTTTTTVPVCGTALECLGMVIAGPLCPGESVNQKLAGLILKKLTKTERGLMRARNALGGKSAGRLVTKARKQLDRLDRKTQAFVSRRRNPISPQCRDSIRAALALIVQQIEAQRL
jgi:hypothetical protein